jgi:hypothetical protein
VARGTSAQAFQHPGYRDSQNVSKNRLVHAAPVEQAKRIFGQHKQIVSLLAGPFDNLLKLREILVDLVQNCVNLLQAVINDAGASLASCNSYEPISDFTYFRPGWLVGGDPMHAKRQRCAKNNGDPRWTPYGSPVQRPCAEQRLNLRLMRRPYAISPFHSPPVLSAL